MPLFTPEFTNPHFIAKPDAKRRWIIAVVVAIAVGVGLFLGGMGDRMGMGFALFQLVFGLYIGFAWTWGFVLLWPHTKKLSKGCSLLGRLGLYIALIATLAVSGFVGFFVAPYLAYKNWQALQKS